MIKRLLITIGIIILLCIYSYLCGKLWELMSPEKFPDLYYPIWFYVIVGIPFGIMFGILLFYVTAIIWPIIGGIINYIVGKEVCSIPNYDDCNFDEE